MENPSPTPYAEWKTADFDALVRSARDERKLSENTLLAYQRAWQRLLAWTGAHRLDPLALTKEDASSFYREMVAATGCTAASSQVQARAALAFAYEHWDAPNPFTRIKPPRSTPPPSADFLQAHDLARLAGPIACSIPAAVPWPCASAARAAATTTCRSPATWASCWCSGARSRTSTAA